MNSSIDEIVNRAHANIIEYMNAVMTKNNRILYHLIKYLNHDVVEIITLYIGSRMLEYGIVVNILAQIQGFDIVKKYPNRDSTRYIAYQYI